MLASIAFDGTFDGWRAAARQAIASRLPPETVIWQSGADETSLFAASAPIRELSQSVELRVPARFLALAKSVACHRDPDRWSALYAALWRIVSGEPELLSVAVDPAVFRLIQMHRSVKRAAHKMKAFVRFRLVADEQQGNAYIAWFEPAHHVVERVAPFFARRFPSMRWSILTPERSAHWDLSTLQFSGGCTRDAAPTDDALEELWRTYYANIFNPARVNTRAMRAEMPRQYWAGLPEATLIAGLAVGASRRVSAMIAQTFADPELIPDDCASYDASNEPIEPRDAPGAWDPAHDPGVAAARQRDRESRAPDRARVVLASTPVSCGVAGWTDPTLLAPGVFYPSGCTTPEQRLRHYAARYSMVEVDATYYALPTRATAAAWAARTPDDFRFDVKAHALMTGHPTDARRLPEWLRRVLPRSASGSPRVLTPDLPRELEAEIWTRFRAALDPLRGAGKLGAIMLQFPRWFTPTRENADVLVRARELLGDDVATIEFRNRRWMEGRIAQRTFSLLRELGLSYVIVDAPPGMESSMPPTAAVTDARLAVFRLHGRRVSTWEAKNDPVTERYRYLYDRDQLRARLPAIRETAFQVARVHLTFNNNHANYATTNALEMAELLADESSQIVRES